MQSATSAIVPVATKLSADEAVRFGQPTYVIKRPWFSFFQRTFRVFAPDGALALFVRHPVFKLRGEWRVYGDEAQTEALLHVKARQIVALNYTYDLRSETTGEGLGGVRSKGLKSLVRDHIDILDTNDQVVGHLIETGHTILRRFFPWLTSTHDIEIGGEVVATVRQKFRFFIKEFNVDQSVALTNRAIDPRLVLTCALLAVVNESQREQG